MGQQNTFLGLENVSPTPMTDAPLTTPSNDLFYTIGHRQTYDALFVGDHTPTKRGKGFEYGGGIVFQTLGEALRWIQRWYPSKDYAVYGVETAKEQLYKKQECDPHFFLLENAPLVRVSATGERL